ncbi:1372_t:CDS:2, partial [Acaulospora colombiana]
SSATTYTNDNNDSLVTVISEKDQNSSALQTGLETAIVDGHNNTENINHSNNNNVNRIDNINIRVNNTVDNKISDNNVNINSNNINSNSNIGSGNNDKVTSLSETSPIETTRPYVNEGLELWNKRRELWTRGNHDPNSLQSLPSENRNNPALANITPLNYNYIYDSLVHEKKKLVKPIPLSYVVTVLVSGWKRDEIWPSEPPSASSSNANGTTLS